MVVNRAVLNVPREQIMEHFAKSPMHQHVRRQSISSSKPPVEACSGAKDQRWHLLDLARISMRRLKLRDRDIAVLRGLLSLLPAQARPDQLVVFASNRVLMERCDGIDERTLRRRIAHLQSCALMSRRTSPNGKRYQVRDEEDGTRLTYGIDLAPLFQNQHHMETLAVDCRRETLRVRTLRAMIRDALFKRSTYDLGDLQGEAQKALRRVLDSGQLQEILTQIEEVSPLKTDQTLATYENIAEDLTARHGQNDRHIHSSNKELLESEEAEIKLVRSTPPVQQPRYTGQADISVAECLELASTAKAMAPTLPLCWNDLIALSNQLAPAIGLKRPLVHEAEKYLGRHGCALAVLGLVEAFDRVRNPEAYLSALVKRAIKDSLDVVRMFRSLARPKYGALLGAQCIPR